MVSDVNSVYLLADAGVPMIAIAWPGMILLLLPIIAVEWLLVAHRTHLQRRKVLWATSVANGLSTVIGVPLTWGALLLFEIGFSAAIPSRGGHGWNSPLERIIATILTAPWLNPVNGRDSWVVPLAALVLLIPFYFVSVVVERTIMKLMLPITTSPDVQPCEVNEKLLSRAVRDANLVSYGFLFAFSIGWLLWDLLHH